MCKTSLEDHPAVIDHLRREHALARGALEKIIEHHVMLNARVGRPIERSTTYRMACEGLGLCAPESQDKEES
jgi:hypothetical protein